MGSSAAQESPQDSDQFHAAFICQRELKPAFRVQFFTDNILPPHASCINRFPNYLNSHVEEDTSGFDEEALRPQFGERLCSSKCFLHSANNIMRGRQAVFWTDYYY